MAEKFDIDLLGGGAAAEQINHWVQEAIADTMDPNKDREAVRKVTCEIKIVASADGQNAAVQYKIIPKFPPDSAGQDMILIKKSTGEGYLVTEEQLGLDFDPVTGEVTMLERKES